MRLDVLRSHIILKNEIKIFFVFLSAIFSCGCATAKNSNNSNFSEYDFLKNLLNEIVLETEYDIKSNLKKLNELDTCEAKYLYGVFYIKGDYLKQDIELGIESLKEAASCGNLYSVRLLAKIYSDGVLVNQNLEKALYWNKYGAKKGDLVLMMNYGLDLLHDDSINNKKILESEAYLLQVAQAEKVYSSYAYYQLGNIYMGDYSPEIQDVCKSLDYYTKSVELGYAHAVKRLSSPSIISANCD